MPERTVRDAVAGRSAITIDSAATLRDAARLMADRCVGSLAVVVDGGAPGIVTERDLLRAAAAGHDFDRVTVRSAMTPRAITVGATGRMVHALHLMHEAGVRHLPVVEDGELLGVVSMRDGLPGEVARAESESRHLSRLAEIIA